MPVAGVAEGLYFPLVAIQVITKLIIALAVTEDPFLVCQADGASHLILQIVEVSAFFQHPCHVSVPQVGLDPVRFPDLSRFRKQD